MSQASKPTEEISVFFSYSHKDEQLRDELAKHLSILQWQGVITSWHDRKISAGNEWAGEIDRNLNTAQVILLLISSDFMASQYCYGIEMKRAIARHDSGEARVIPIILRPVVWQGAPFGKLQALPKDAMAVTLWKNQDEAFENVAQGIRAAVEELRSQQASHAPNVQPTTAKPKFRTLIVDQLHRGDYATITEAIEAAKPGDRILVRPGLYQEGLVIDKPLEIIGDGDRDEIVVQAKGKNVILFETTRGRVLNLTLRQMGGEDFYCVDIPQGRLDLEDCDITSQGWPCVAIHDGADPRLRRNRIHDGKATGISIYENGKGTIEENEIFNNDYAGIQIEIGGDPTVRKNRIHSNDSVGISIYENGKGTIEENEIFNNDYAGMYIETGGNPTVRRNHINKNGYQGISINNGGAGTFEDNDLRDNARGAWNISEDSLPNVKRVRNKE